MSGFGRAARGLVITVFGLAVAVPGRTATVSGRSAAVSGRAAEVFGRAGAVFGRAVVLALIVAFFGPEFAFGLAEAAVFALADDALVRAAAGLRAVLDPVVVFAALAPDEFDFAAVPRFGAGPRVTVASGLAVDMAFAAAVSALAAADIDLVAVFIACRAVDMVLADVVALVAAAVILPAAEVTLVAADDTVRAAAADVGAVLAVVRRELAAPAFVVVVVPGRVAGFLAAPVLADLPRAVLAVLRRAAVRVVVVTGTDLPPS